MSDKYEIHISDVRAFKSCRRQWNWVSNLRNYLEPAVPYSPFLVGRGVHYAIEQYYRQFGQGNIEDLDEVETMELRAPDDFIPEWYEAELAQMEEDVILWEAEKIALQEDLAQMEGMLRNYYYWATGPQIDVKNGWRDKDFTFISHETEFEVPLRTGTGRASTKVFGAGRFDGLVRRKKDGTLWIWEVKTTRSVKELVRSLSNDEQAGFYMVAAAEMMGEPIAGVLYNIMRKKIPTRPRLLKSGHLSQAKNIDTTPETYWQTVLSVHSDEFIGQDALERKITAQKMRNHYAIMDYLESAEYRSKHLFFARIPIYRSEQELNQLQLDTWKVALEMTREDTPLYPSPGWLTCNMCKFKGPCLTLNAGGNYELLLKHEYRKRRKWDPLTRKEQSNA